ncbi:MAG: hypothetical protein AB7D27_17765 [Desulfomicrobium sp.]
MDFLVNDLSLHGQFADLDTFRDSIKTIMTMKETSRRYGFRLYCPKTFVSSPVTSSMCLQQAINNALDIDQKRSFLSWVTSSGPFMEDVRQHHPDDYFTCSENIVTDTAVGEAAWCCLHKINRDLISVAPSDWCRNPIEVTHVIITATERLVAVNNHWDLIEFKAYLDQRPKPISSWDDLERASRLKYDNLYFSTTAFAALEGHPFSSCAADRIFFILSTLDFMATEIDKNGKRTVAGNEYYQKFFAQRKEAGGRGSIFSDSSEGEKHDFKEKLTFTHPEKKDEYIFCPMHGKVQTPQLRVHFSWPIRPQEPIYIMYVGPKITRR